MDLEEQETSVGLGSLYCFIDQKRPCSPECMAYTTHSSPGDELNEQQGHCVLLVGTTRVGKHAVIIASMMRDQFITEKKRREDSKRVGQTPPNGVLSTIPGIPHGR